MTSLTKAPRIGKAIETEFLAIGITSLEDLIEYIPRAYDDRREERTLLDATQDNPVINCEIAIVGATSFRMKNKGEKLFKAFAKDINGRTLEILCFNRPFLESQLTIGSTWFIHATVQRQGYEYSTSKFELKKTKEELGLGSIIPIYPISGNLRQNTIRSAVGYALENVEIKEALPERIREKYGLMGRKEALLTLHAPTSFESIERAKRTLSFIELFYLELNALRNKTERIRKSQKSGLSQIESYFIKHLSFTLTEDQESVLGEIREDLDGKKAMNRLLQGDVGSGKTLIAWISALHEIDKGNQVAFMAPTELLVRQHAENAYELFKGIGVRIALYTADIERKEKEALLRNLKDGKIDLVIGTHALFSERVEFKRLGFVIIDEEHRFGVEQRRALIDKGLNPHVLTMTATPIPRTLALTIYSDQDISTIKHLPNGRVPITTYLVDERKREKMYETIRVEFMRGHQAYFVYPRIDESDDSIRGASEMYAFLKKKYPEYPSALIHSKIDEKDKIRILKDFQRGKISYLVSTSIVEVGIDIKRATCMVIEHADRFGAAQLHQLRGRVGRSELRSYCFLVYDRDGLTEDAKKRLTALKNTNDGFLIAEKDLETRGPGDFAGVRQSGFLKLKYATLLDAELIENTRYEAERILEDDKGLIKAENSEIREYLAKSDS